MATIKITELRPAGSELFQDSESFLNELTEKEGGNILGAARELPANVRNLVSQNTISIGISLVSNTIVSQVTLVINK